MKTIYMIDGGFLIKKYQKAFRSVPMTARYVSEFVRAFNTTYNNGNPIFRIFYYDSKPYDGVETKPVSKSRIEFKASSVYTYRTQLLNDLKFSELFSVRLGNIACRGWILKRQAYGKTTPLVDDDYKPNFEQKGVDIKIGLDMAWSTMNKNAERIVLIASDADFVPVMKFARVHGLQVMLGTLGHSFHPTVREHCDFFVNADMRSIFPAVPATPLVTTLPTLGLGIPAAPARPAPPAPAPASPNGTAP